MNVPLITEGVVVHVSILLVATTVHVPQDARWTPMVMLVMVSLHTRYTEIQGDTQQIHNDTGRYRKRHRSMN